MPFYLSPFVAGALLLVAVPALPAQDAVSLSPVPVTGTAATSVVPHYIKYSGTLPSAPGRANVVDVKFALYTNPTGGEALWSETQQVTLDSTGKYSVLLGSMTPAGVPGTIFATGMARWIGVTLGNEEESARTILVAAPYSLKAADADTLGGHPAADYVLKNGGPRPAGGGTDITQINVTSPITGGGTGPTVSIGLDTSALAMIASANSFTSSNTFNAGIVANSPSPATNAIYATTTASNLFPVEIYSQASVNGWGLGTYSTNYPMFAQATDTTAGDETIAVYGQTFNTGSYSFGIFGQAQNGNGASGVYGLSGSASTEGSQVQPGFGGAGVWADTNQFGGAGASLLATADDNDAGIFASNSPTGYYTVYLQNDDTTGDAGPLKAYNSNNQSFCEIDGAADLTCSGSISTAVVGGGPGHRVASYGVQSAENWIEDFGTAQLQGGHASVTLDPTFASTVNTGVEYHVFLTPNGDSKGLYIANKGQGSFEVLESNGGKSNIAFDYRIVAKRKGYESLRLADMTEKAEKAKTPSGKPYAVKAQPVRRHATSPADRRGPGLATVVSPVHPVK
jgi:hypothetical protein